GTLTFTDDGRFTYTPDPLYSGPDSFTYQARNSAGAFSQPATVTINVVPRAEPPTIAVADATGVVGSVIPLTISAALTDGDGSETLSIQLGTTVNGQATGLPGDITLSAGVSTLQADGT